MRAFSSLVALVWLFGGAYAKSEKKKKDSKKECASKFCCTADEDYDLTIRFLLTFKSSIPSSLCTSTQQELEHDFVDSYNKLARLNCDKPCFRRAKDARIVAAPENTFVSCAEKDPYHGYRERKLATLGTNSTIIIEIELEQAGVCTTALDGQTGLGTQAHPDEFEAACGKPAWAWDFPYYQDVCSPSTGYYEDGYDEGYDETCCCACGTDRSLGELDLTKIYRSSHTLYNLKIYLLSAQELFARDDCGDLTVEFERTVLLSFSGSTSGLSLSDSESLFEDVSSCYNDLAFENCDNSGRAILNGTLEPVDPVTLTRRRLQRRGRSFNAFSSRSCAGRGCAASRVSARASCPANVCPDNDDLDLFTGILRRLVSTEEEQMEKAVDAVVEHYPGRKGQATADIERVLSGIPITTPLDLILDECLCLTHEEAGKGVAPTDDEFVTRFNTATESDGRFSDLGRLTEAVELVFFPTGGPPKDIQFWLPVHVHGSPCNLDYRELQALADVIQTSYNDIVVEDCDKPLFRQILSALTWMDTLLNCHKSEFVVHIKVSLRCHGHCPKKHPLFGDYKDAYHRLLYEAEIEGEEVEMLYDPAQYNPVIQAYASAGVDASSYEVEVEQDARRTAEEEEDPGSEGVCVVEGSRNPKSPTKQGLEDRVNADLPTADITSITILTEPLCRCEGLYEHFYAGTKGPKEFKYFRTINGIFVVPNDFKTCKYHRSLGEERELGGGSLPCSSFF